MLEAALVVATPVVVLLLLVLLFVGMLKRDVYWKTVVDNHGEEGEQLQACATEARDHDDNHHQEK